MNNSTANTTIAPLDPGADSKPTRAAINRANAAKSTGPTTPAGKETSSQNATRHGLLARTIVLEGEALDRFTALLNSLIDIFQPRNCVESALVENMAVARWRQLRVWGMEQAEISQEMQKQASLADSNDAIVRDARTRAAGAFRIIGDNSRALDIFNRYETRFERQYLRSFDRLEKLRTRTDLKKARTKSDFSKRSQLLAEDGTFC